MKGPVTEIEVRYRLSGAEDESGWTCRRYPLGQGIFLRGLTPGEQYDIGVRYLGPVPSAWTTTVHTVATTTRTGTAALPPSVFGNAGSVWLSGTEVDWTATDTTAHITVTAGTLQVGEGTIAYSASSADLTDGTASEVRTVHLYYDDPRRLGGARTLGVTTDKPTRTAAWGRIYIATITITFDTSGGTGTGGGGDIGGGGGGSGQIEP